MRSLPKVVLCFEPSIPRLIAHCRTINFLMFAIMVLRYVATLNILTHDLIPWLPHLMQQVSWKGLLDVLLACDASNH